MKKLVLFLLMVIVLSGCGGEPYRESDEYKNVLEDLCAEFGEYVELETKFIPNYYLEHSVHMSTAECLVKYNGRWITRGLYENGGGNIIRMSDNNSFIKGFALRGLLP